MAGAPPSWRRPIRRGRAAYFEMARRTGGALAARARDRSSLFPKIVVEES